MITFASLALDWRIADSKIGLLLLLLSLLLTLHRTRQRLLLSNRAPGKMLRFAGVATLNVIAVLVLAAWLGNLAIKSDGGVQALLVTDSVVSGEAEPPGDDFDQRYHLIPVAGQAPDDDKPSHEHQSIGIVDAAQIRLEHGNLGELIVQGYGLPEAQWPLFADVTIRQLPVPPIVGVVDLEWPRQLLPGNALTVSGRYLDGADPDNAKSGGIVTVSLLDPVDTVVATTRVRHNESFSLGAWPKANGHYQYRLQVAGENGDLISDDPVPLEVGNALLVPLAKVLVIQSAPSFESKHLKNWASEQGASLLLLTTISKDKFVTQAVNLPGVDDTRLTPALFGAFDLLIMDGRALVNLSAGQQGWLQQAVAQGLGLLVLADSQLVNSQLNGEAAGLLSAFRVQSAGVGSGDGAGLIPNWPGNHSELAFATQALDISAAQGIPLIRSGRRPLSLYRQQGLGKVALSILKDRYRWRLNGEMQTYSHYWQWLFSRLARTRSDSRFVAPPTDSISLLHRRSQICLISKSKSDKLSLWMNGSEIALAGERFSPYRHCAVYWPKSVGWQRFALQDESGKVLDVAYRYTFTRGQWQSWRQHRRLVATAGFIQARQWSGGDSVQSASYQPLDNLWYWWLLVICASLLWLERKLD